jgi:hypothetical protein
MLRVQRTLLAANVKITLTSKCTLSVCLFIFDRCTHTFRQPSSITQRMAAGGEWLRGWDGQIFQSGCLSLSVDYLILLRRTGDNRTSIITI